MIAGAHRGAPVQITAELGQAVDRFFRKTKPGKLTAYVRQATLPPVVRRVLEARFEAVEYGMTAEQLLFNRVEGAAAQEPCPVPELDVYAADKVSPKPEANLERQDQ